MFAASKYTALAAASFALMLALALTGAAAGGGNHDRIPPSAPTNLRATSATLSSVALAWDASTDNVAVAGYSLYVNQKRIKVSGTSYTAIGLQCGQSVDVWIVAYDSSNNRSLATSAMVSTAACPDLQTPSAPTGFTQQATTLTGAVLAWSPSTDNVGVVGYDVYRDLLLVSNSAQPNATLGGLSCGSAYQYQVDAYDAAGNHSSRSSVWVQTGACGDAQAPSAPSGLTLSARTAASLSFSWTGSTDNVGVSGYRVLVNGAPATTTTQTSATVTLLSCGATYSVSVDAYDAAGNHSAAAVTSAATDACPPSAAVGDTTPPTQPTSLRLVSTAQTSVDLGWAASSDATGVVGYDLFLDGQSKGTTTQTATTVSGLTCGTAYTFALDAYDAAGNHSTRATLSGSTAACASPQPTADTTPPTTPVNLAVGSATQTSISLNWSASTDHVGVAGYGVYRNGTSVSSVTQPGATVSGLTCGTAYSFAVDAFDAAGNHSTKAQITSSTAACADAQAPSAPANVVATSRTATSIALSWSASSDNFGVTGYGLYKGGAQVSTVTGTTGIFSGLSCNTNYTLAVDAYDAAGNHSAKTTVMVATTACADSTPPSTPTGLAASNVTQTSVDLGWAASSDNVAVTGYDVYRNGTKMATVTGTSSSQTGLACGTSYSFGVVAFDAAGNRSQQASVNSNTNACAPASTCTGVNVETTTDPQQAVNANPSGTTFCITPGVHRVTAYYAIVPKLGDRFIGEPGAILNGSRVLTQWTQSGNTWVVSSQTQQHINIKGGECDNTHPLCNNQDDVFFDNVPLSPVASASAVGPGQFFFDYANDKIYIGDNPSGHTVETTVAAHAFSGCTGGCGAGTLVQGLIIEKFADDAIDLTDGTVQDNEVRLNHTTGIVVLHDGVIRNNYVHDNGLEGLSSGGNPTLNLLVEGNELARNGWYAGYAMGWEGGGAKWMGYDGLVIRSNYVHDNHGMGLWLDTDNIHVTIENNRIENNGYYGIYYELSYDATIRNNTVTGNGFILGSGWIIGAGIGISESQNVEIYGNDVEDNLHGIGALQRSTGLTGKYGAHEVANLYVHDNTIKSAGNSGLVETNNDTSYYNSKNNRFQHNTYILSCNQPTPFAWKDPSGGTYYAYVTKDQWVASQNDTTGSFSTFC